MQKKKEAAGQILCPKTKCNFSRCACVLDLETILLFLSTEKSHKEALQD